jgi:hypothetical protein
LHIWQENLEVLGTSLKAGVEIYSGLRNLKKDLMDEYDILDIKSELEELYVEEHVGLKQIFAEMHNL